MEKELIKRAKNNDLSAFEELIRMHEKNVYNIALKILGNEHDASDAAQEAFIKMFKNIRKFRGDSKFSTWVYRIAH
ncbi:MAG: sigma-70 family RNA polymerase sigma factor, partial [Clostridia bacterium]|nr:sigma-70 family RNA polymerase sigma factor [Clostridia bacterium]